MNKKISVIIKEPGKKPRHVNISDTGRNLQNTVGGEVGEILFATDLVILFNEKQEGLPECCQICGKTFNGPVIFCGIGHKTPDGADELLSVPVSFQQFKKLFPGLWEEGGER